MSSTGDPTQVDLTGMRTGPYMSSQVLLQAHPQSSPILLVCACCLTLVKSGVMVGRAGKVMGW